VTAAEKLTLKSLGYLDVDVREMDVRVAKSMCASGQKRPFSSGRLPPTWLKSAADREPTSSILVEFAASTVLPVSPLSQ